MVVAGGQGGRGGQAGRYPRGGPQSNQVKILAGQGGGARLEMFHGEVMNKRGLHHHQPSRTIPVQQRDARDKRQPCSARRLGFHVR